MERMDSEPAVIRLNRKVDRTTLIVAGLLAIAFLWRLGYFLEMYASPYGNNLTLDSLVYHEIALEVASGRWSGGTTFFQAPLYPWLLGTVYAVISPSQTAAKLLQVLLGVASCWLIYRVAEGVFDRAVAQVALAISAVYGMYLYFANELLVVTLIVFLDLLGIHLLLRASSGDRRILWGVAGVVFGLSAIARPTILPFAAAVCLWAAIIGWRSGRMRAAVFDGALFAVGVVVPIAPVTIHNYLADGDLVLVAANGGVNFFIGNNPHSDGITAVVPGTRADRRGAAEDQVSIARRDLGRPDATPREISDYWYERAWGHIRSDPARALRHTAFKAFILFNAHEVSNNRVIDFVTRHSVVYSLASVKFWLVLPLAVAGLVMGGGRRRERGLLLVFVGAYSATLIAFFINARFRLPMAAILIVFASAAVIAWARMLNSRKIDRRAAVAFAAALLTALLVRPLPALRVPEAQAFFNEAEAFRVQGDFASAARWYGAALDAYPGFCDAAYSLAKIHTDIIPDPRRVIEILEAVVESCASDTGMRSLLAEALCAVDRCEEGHELLAAIEESSAARSEPEPAVD